MQYTEITALVAPASAESAADVLHGVTGGGVVIETPFVQQDLESGATAGEGPACLRAYVTDAADAGGVVRAAADAFIAAGIAASVSQRAVREEDWAEAWKAYFDVERFGRVVIVASWRRYEPAEDDITVTLDPGMAFGTGQHETTRMCLEALDARVRPGMRVLDAGSGSGILAVAAAKLGAREVLAVDVDADCVRITGENAAANGVAGIVRAERVDSGEPRWAAGPPFDLIVANIIASTIIDLAPSFAAALAPDGRLVASGIIAAREDEVCGALAAAGLRVEGVRAMGEWRCVEAVQARGRV